MDDEIIMDVAPAAETYDTPAAETTTPPTAEVDASVTETETEFVFDTVPETEPLQEESTEGLTETDTVPVDLIPAPDHSGTASPSGSDPVLLIGNDAGATVPEIVTYDSLTDSTGYLQAILGELNNIHLFLDERLPVPDLLQAEAETETEPQTEMQTEAQTDTESESETEETFSLTESEQNELMELLKSVNNYSGLILGQQKTAHENVQTLTYIQIGGLAMIFAALCVLIISQHVRP